MTQVWRTGQTRNSRQFGDQALRLVIQFEGILKIKTGFRIEVGQHTEPLPNFAVEVNIDLLVEQEVALPPLLHRKLRIVDELVQIPKIEHYKAVGLKIDCRTAKKPVNGGGKFKFRE